MHPVESLEDMARDVFASDDDLDEFLTFVHTDWQAGLEDFPDVAEHDGLVLLPS